MTFKRGPKPNMSVEDRFWEKVGKATETGCFIWKGSTRGSYGSFFLKIENGKQKIVQAHRFAYELIVGPIPDGKRLVCTCGNKLCINPNHMKLVDYPNQKIDAGSIKDIIKRHNDGEYPSQIAKTYNVTANAIRNIIKKKSWAQ